jgi:hypothetical protein
MGQGSTSEATVYQFRDTSVREGLIYEYQLADVSYAGEIDYHNIIEIEIEKLNKPETYILGDAYPNPFNPKTIINYELPITNVVELKIYNLLGQKVVTLVSETQNAGYHQVEWDASGFPSGVYFYRIKAGTYTDIKKILLIK